MGEKIKLRDAIESHSVENGIYSSFETYRKEAKRCGYILIGGIQVPTIKDKGSWVVDLSDFKQAVKSFIDKKAEDTKHTQLMMEDHKKGDFSLWKNMDIRFSLL